MRNFPNIEKLPGKNHYTGYCAGAIYHITKIDGGGWRARVARHELGQSWNHELIIRNTLEGISNELTQRAEYLSKEKARHENAC